MPLLNKEHYSKDFVVGFWQIDEALADLEQRMVFTDQDRNYYEKFLVDKRRSQWLASRILLRELAGEDFAPVLYDMDGKPFFSSGKGHFSYSHAGNMAAAIYSRYLPVGIDIERITPRLVKVKERFLNSEELEFMPEGEFLDYLCLGWCGKEALYKIYGKRKLDFRDHMQVSIPFIGNSGRFTGAVHSGENSASYELQYVRIQDYMSVFVAGYGS